MTKRSMTKAMAKRMDRSSIRSGKLARYLLMAVAGSLLLALPACQSNTESQDLSGKAKDLWRSGRYVEASRSFITLTEIHPDSPYVEEALFWAANLNQHYLSQPDQATRFYQQVIIRFPEGEYFIQAKENLANLYEENKETQHRALQIYQQLVLNESVKNRHEFYQFKLALLYIKEGKMDQARLAFRDLLVNFPNSDYIPEVNYLIGYTYFLEKRFDLAMAVFRHTVKAFPDNPLAARAQFFLADTLAERGKMREAIRAFKALKEKYHNPEIIARRIKTLESRLRRGAN